MGAALNSNEDMRDLYRELILDHAKSPRHFGRMPDATHSAEGINPLCGDKLSLYLSVGPDGRIDDATFEGSGCAISVASASLLTETVIGRTTTEALRYFSTLVARLTGAAAGQDRAADQFDLGKLAALEGVREYPSRVKCATLAWHALKSALRNEAKPVTTE